MASGDAQRTWFPEMIEMLHQTWSASMSENELLALRDRLETTLETIRSERHILPAMMWCPHYRIMPSFDLSILCSLSRSTDSHAPSSA